MKIAELSRTTGVTIASIKYYRREGILPAGKATAANQVDYDQRHVQRLRLIRALIEIGGLSVTAVRRTLAAVDDDSTPLHDAFASVMHNLDDAPDTAGHASVRDEVVAWLNDRQWAVDPEAPAVHQLTELIATARSFGFPTALSELDNAAGIAQANAEFEVAYARDRSTRVGAVETMLVGTVVYERILGQIRRLALESVSRRLGDGPEPAR